MSVDLEQYLEQVTNSVLEGTPHGESLELRIRMDRFLGRIEDQVLRGMVGQYLTGILRENRDLAARMKAIENYEQLLEAPKATLGGQPVFTRPRPDSA